NALALSPEPPATAASKNACSGFCCSKICRMACRPSASPGPVHQEKTSTCFLPPPALGSPPAVPEPPSPQADSPSTLVKMIAAAAVHRRLIAHHPFEKPPNFGELTTLSAEPSTHFPLARVKEMRITAPPTRSLPERTGLTARRPGNNSRHGRRAPRTGRVRSLRMARAQRQDGRGRLPHHRPQAPLPHPPGHGHGLAGQSPRHPG